MIPLFPSKSDFLNGSVKVHEGSNTPFWYKTQECTWKGKAGKKREQANQHGKKRQLKRQTRKRML